jgi:hypothetical protein
MRATRQLFPIMEMRYILKKTRKGQIYHYGGMLVPWEQILSEMLQLSAPYPQHGVPWNE